MSRLTGATNTQKTVMLSLAEGWMLRYVDLHGWCLFQPNRSRPFARVKKRTVDTMTANGWLTPGIATKGLGYRPAKELTAAGRAYAERLMGKNWGSDEAWDPFDQRAVRKGPKEEPVSPSPAPMTAHDEQPAQPAKGKSGIFAGLITEPKEPAPAPERAEESADAPALQLHAASESDSGAPLAMPKDESRDEGGEQPRFRLVA